MKKKLLLITPFFSPNIGGVETRLDDLIKSLSKRGIDVVVLTYQPLTTHAKGKTFETRPGSSIIRIPWIGKDIFHKLLKLPFFEVLYILPGLFIVSLYYMLRNAKHIDAIHTPGLNSAIIGRSFKKIFKKRWVVSTHTIYGFQSNDMFSFFSRWTLKHADHIVALSDPSRNELIGLGLPERIISTEYSWVDKERFRPLNKQTCREMTGLNPDVFSVLFVGRLLPEKGAEVVMHLAEKLPEIHFTIVGTGPQERMIREKSHSMPNVTFAGYIKQDKLPFFYNAVDVFILPSLYQEGLGRVLLEALSCGIPAILHKNAAISMLIQDAAFIVPNNLEKLVSSLKWISGQRELLEKKRKRARALSENLFSESNVNGFIKAYGWLQ